jgi:hypothetical protein
MAERDELVAALAAEVLGPRGGIRERLEAPTHRAGEFVTPLEEYVTGVLAPHEAPAVAEIDSDDDLLGEDDEGADDQADVGAPAVPLGASPVGGPGRSPSLDPRVRPCSIGLSILLEGETPTIDICATWAWYERNGPTAWQRDPRSQLWTSVDCTTQRQSYQCTDQDGVREASIEIRARAVPQGWRVSIFLVNTTRIGHPGAEHHVYQPQIRICAGNGTRLLPIDDDSPFGDQEDASLALLYSGKRALSRGHLCGAIWRDIDPERPLADRTYESAPFSWVDGALLQSIVAARFSPADARTELVPCYSVSAPQLDATARHGSGVFDPEQLCELWNSSDLQAALEPLAVAYENWIGQQDASALSLPERHRPTATMHLQQCRDVLRRLREALLLLYGDDDVRLAFCFANKAMAVQSRWSRQRVDSWRPFQLVFQLINIPALVQSESADRLACDLLWIPTGGGKTEAYLGLAAFTIAYRRLDARRHGRIDGGGGVSVISRYTLRLLTIQQFRRALALITACELLRVHSMGTPRGWRPKQFVEAPDLIWGGARFSIGLWVGGSVTPNGLFSFSFPAPNGSIQNVWGALSILKGEDNGQGEGDPAQVTTCPACNAILAVPPDGFAGGRDVILHLVVQSHNFAGLPSVGSLSGPIQPRPGGQTPEPLFRVLTAQIFPHNFQTDYYTLTLRIVPYRDVSPSDVDSWVRLTVLPAINRRTRLVCARGSRPGYFFRSAPFRGGRQNDVDFEIYCPNPSCALNQSSPWSEITPDGLASVQQAFEIGPGESSRIPIPALTVDDQIYHRCPTVIVATVDKFARLAFEPRAAGMFGIIDHYCDRHGYYRSGCPPTRQLPPNPTDHPPGVNPIPVSPFARPDLILQDELHLIEGPLGSMVGLYETAFETLATCRVNGRIRRPKYVASSATVRKAADQVQSLYNRHLVQFPPPGIDIDDNFFAAGKEEHPLESDRPGRLYVGICAPGRGAQTPIVRIWSRLIQQMEDRLQAGVALAELDPFWSMVGYFNAIRELAGAVALARQDIPERMAFISPSPRTLPESEPMELSSRAASLELPGMLERLGERLGVSTPVNTVVSTSMFGTGVDVSRLSLMVVHGQPKTSSSYIQATGRVGRIRGGLVVTFYRASRPRDLSHYEFFAGYHRELYRHVEPVSVNPFSPRARDRALGPIAVALLRQGTQLSTPISDVPIVGFWRIQQNFNGGIRCRAGDMAGAQGAPEVTSLPTLFEARGASQPLDRRPNQNVVLGEVAAEIARWSQLAAFTGASLLFHESSMVRRPTNPVVLGDLAHEVLGLPVAFENAPNSLREVEAATTFRGRT